MDEFGWMDEHLADARRWLSAPGDDFLNAPLKAPETTSLATNPISAFNLGPSMLASATSFIQDDFVYFNSSMNFQPECLSMLNVVEQSSTIFEGSDVVSQVPLTSSEQNLPQQPQTGPGSHKCVLCGALGFSSKELQSHYKIHGHSCYQCGQSFSTHMTLAYHASETGHEAYRCNYCDARFSRLDVLQRHQLKHMPPRVKYSCKHCRKWRAPNGFDRKDHLTQHLQNYHHIDTNESFRMFPGSNGKALDFFKCCSHEGCPLFRPESDRTWKLRGNPLFKSRGEYTKHMRQEHNETPFPCTVTGCKRVDGKGYFRKRDLIKHKKREHEISYETETTTVEADNLVEGFFTDEW